ncbi:glycosyltransferase family 1 protein [Chromobacterium sp. LK1]|uniref:glycosyltransferase family 4 protein n=1 Tax=Chromobacterium sp. LK1 TaxID=1628193 RepID=UPI0009E279D3|nr:glycosyltransferase family 1 protein [Chromobacterium sp. LK1]
MSIVFDNIIFSLQRSGGGSRFWANIIEPHLSRLDVAFIEHPGAHNNLYQQKITSSPLLRDHALPLSVARYLNFNRKFFKSRKYVFHSSYFRVNADRNCINITTVHDLIYEKFLSGAGAVIHKHQKRKALQCSDVIVCVSEHTKKDLLDFYPFCQGKELVVIRNGVEPLTFAGDKIAPVVDMVRPYFLYVGHRGELKGFHLIYDALESIGNDFDCIVVGAPFSEEESRLLVQRGLTDRVVNVGRVSDAELARYYAQAQFFFFPSLYEGFGIPPLEAMAAGCPVVASNRSSIPEVVGDAAILFDPDDPDSLGQALIDVQNGSVRQELIDKGGKRVMDFGWGAAVSGYAQLYSDLLI